MTQGERIYTLRKRQGLTMEELGQMLGGLKRQTIQKYEKGDITDIPAKNVIRMAEIFGVSPTYILGWSDEEGKPLEVSAPPDKPPETIGGHTDAEILEAIEKADDATRELIFKVIGLK